uniref:Uncharacterized protein n=1 Tax=Oryza meridionalis TaxID=40149 RepID=A0A0E0DN71_9ORYZ
MELMARMKKPELWRKAAEIIKQGVRIQSKMEEEARAPVTTPCSLSNSRRRPISGASMNPARTIGPAIILGRYTSIWVYIAGPVFGAVAGAWAYNLIRFTDKPLREITMTASFIRSTRRN